MQDRHPCSGIVQVKRRWIAKERENGWLKSVCPMKRGQGKYQNIKFHLCSWIREVIYVCSFATSPFHILLPLPPCQHKQKIPWNTCPRLGQEIPVQLENLICFKTTNRDVFLPFMFAHLFGCEKFGGCSVPLRATHGTGVLPSWLGACSCLGLLLFLDVSVCVPSLPLLQICLATC